MVTCVEPRLLRAGHVVDAGDGGELLFQRRRHGRGHGLRAGAGQAGGHGDGGEIHGGQVAHRQKPVAEDSGDEDGHHDQGRHDRPSDEEVHGVLPCSASAGLDLHRGPGHEPHLAVGHHRLAGLQALVDHRHAVQGPVDLDGRFTAFLSGPTTKTKVPSWPVTTAPAGTVRTAGSTVRTSSTSTNWPGQRELVLVREFGLQGDGARVCASTSLSMKTRRPFTVGTAAVPGGLTWTSSVACGGVFLHLRQLVSGDGEAHADGSHLVDDHQGRVVGPDHVALFDEQASRAPGDREP